MIISSRTDVGVNTLRMPAEWENHAATWMAWPHNRDTWPENLDLAQTEFVNLVALIARDEPVRILGPAGAVEDECCQKFEQAGLPESDRISFVPVATNDAWIRDYGPTFVIDQVDQINAVDWQYNAWGGKYPPFDFDRQVVRELAKHKTFFYGDQSLPIHTSSLCIEGGAIEANESGVLLCTESCALNSNRNPDWCRAEIESEFNRLLGTQQVVWMTGDGLAGDDTDGHVDQLARFISDDMIVIASCAPDDPQYAGLSENQHDLDSELERLSLNINWVPLNLPQPIDSYGRRIPASYCNFYFTRHSILVPQFGDEAADAAALETLGTYISDRQIIGCPSLNLSVGLGSIHCLTQQQPNTDSSALK